jgi:pyruvate dehydrogenase E2 component (dihydrolipoamide acetyltransferase)
MVREFKLPDVGEGVAEGELVQWLVEVGDTVSEDQPVAEVETDKAVVEVPSPVNGTIRELHWAEGDVVPVGEVLVTFNVEGEDDTEAEAATDDASAEESEATADESDSGGRVFAAPTARRLARELDVDIGAVEGSGPGGRVTEGDVRAAAESGDEQAAEAEAAAADDGDEDRDLKPATRRRSDTDGAQDGGGGAAAVESADRERTLAAPATRKLAEEEGIDLNAVPATEEREGEAYVTPAAVREYAEAQQAAQQADAEAVQASGADQDAAAESGAGPGASTGERIPYRGVRRTIGKQMERSKFTAPHVTHHDQVDVTGLVEAREKLKPRAEAAGVSLSYMPFILKAVVAALKEFPILNSRLDEEAEEIVVNDEYNVGVATATEAGLLVPVVDNVDQKSMEAVAAEMNDLVARARDRSIAREEMQGGTFTVTNFGAIGGEYATPIINYPETAILGLGAIKKRPWVVEREDGTEAVEPRSVMTLSLSIDHRVIDGAEAAQFTNRVKEYLEDPTLLLFE